MSSGDEVVLAYAAAPGEVAETGGAPGDGWTQPLWARRLWTYRVEVVSVLVALAALVVAYRARPIVLLDDAAITGRYAERLATGHGWTYNDGDRTNGASAPLHTMVVAVLHLVGLGTIAALRLVATVAFALTAGLVSLVAGRIGGLSAALLGGAATASALVLRETGLGGMESLLAAVLGLVVMAALAEERDTLAGVVLGLAIVNKLDAGFLALAVGLAYVAVHRRPPWRIAAISGAVVAPWVLFATIYFGSPLPYSMTQKISGSSDNPAWEHRTSWVWDSFEYSRAKPLVVLAIMGAALIPWMARQSRGKATTLSVAVLWPMAHGFAFSVVEMGDAYPWYTIVLYPPLIVAGAVGAVTVPRLAVARLVPALAPGGDRASAPGPAAVPVGGLVGVVVALVVLGVVLPPNTWLKSAASELKNGHEVHQYEAFEAQRREAGRYVAAVSQPGDVVEACWGWVAYEAIDVTIKETCPLNTRDPVGEPRWSVLVTYPGTDPAEVPENAVLRASFISEVGEGGRVDVIEIGPRVAEEPGADASSDQKPD